MHEGMIRIKLTVIFLFIQCTNIFALNVLSDTLIIPFEHKQSAIVHKNTLAALDSVVIILKRNNDITLSIEGYAYVDEGNDTICKYLSLNRALFVRDCIIGRGIDSSRISFIKAMGQWKPEKKGKYKVNNDVHSRVELMLIYPPSPENIFVPDADEDGISDSEDGCPDKYGYKENNGCPLKDVIIVPFNTAHAYISSDAYPVMDKLLVLLRENSAYTISLSGHTSKNEGVKYVTDKLAKERTEIISRYLISRNLTSSRITAVTNYGSSRPVNAQKNLQEISNNECVEILINKNIP